MITRNTVFDLKRTYYRRRTAGNAHLSHHTLSILDLELNSSLQPQKFTTNNNETRILNTIIGHCTEVVFGSRITCKKYGQYISRKCWGS